MALTSEVHDSIRHYVWCGVYLRDDVRLFIRDDYPDLLAEDHDGEIGKLIDDEFREKAVAETQWPEETDCDRLDRSFDELNQEGIISLHNIGCQYADGLAAVAQEHQRRGGEKSGYVGFCFYQRQDLDGAVRGHGLQLTMGALDGDDKQAVEVGRRVQQKCETCGLQVQWDGTAKGPLMLHPLTWMRRGARMTLTAADLINDPTEDDVLAAIEADEVCILASGQRSFIQCRQHEDAAYQLEYHDGASDQHYEVVEFFVEKEAVQWAFLKYLLGDESWRSDFEWESVAL